MIGTKEYENLVREGINAAKAGKKKLASRLLKRAAAQNPYDARVWLWLTATTSEETEQREYLERAVAADPYNPAARRGLRALGRNPEEIEPAPSHPADPDLRMPAVRWADPIPGGAAPTGL